MNILLLIINNKFKMKSQTNKTPTKPQSSRKPELSRKPDLTNKATKGISPQDISIAYQKVIINSIVTNYE
jgi:hypothetical protein